MTDEERDEWFGRVELARAMQLESARREVVEANQQRSRGEWNDTLKERITESNK